MKSTQIAAALLALSLHLQCTRADVALAPIFNDNMVLQRDLPLHFWGAAAPNEQIHLTLADQSQQTSADPAGHWHIDLKPLPASDRPLTLTLSASNTLSLHNILVGEVWICSGQSNMEYPLDRTKMHGTSPPPASVKDISKQELQSANDPLLRIFRVEKNLRSDLPNDGWHPATGEPLRHFSAVGYYFGKNLRADLHVPVGLIQSAWGGSRIERWTPADAYQHDDTLRAATTQPGTMDGDAVGRYYDRMVAPMAGFPIRGMIWYQGESNLIETNNLHYLEKFRDFADAWRSAWNQPDFPIGTVQIVPYLYTRRKDPVKHTPETLPEFWAIQLQCAQQIKNVGLVPTMDLADHLTNIHPWNKWDVGDRLARWARAQVYHEPGVEWTGPILQHVTPAPSEVRVQFSHAEGMHGPQEKTIAGFELKSPDGNWRPAAAQPDGADELRVSADGISQPHGIRYAWRENAPAGLFNSAGLPALPFLKEW
ncbi:MAG: sialate O-acetylesterase [Phycisphaerae bacterium]